jgi:hypothetical protein
MDIFARFLLFERTDSAGSQENPPFMYFIELIWENHPSILKASGT